MAQKSLKNFRAVPPGNGICHQVNLEYLSPLVHVKDLDGRKVAYPDSCFGTDSHTTQIDGLGVLGWGVGGIEAEAAMVGQPSYMKLPDVVGFKLTGKLREGVNATDLVLTVVNMLRKKGVVGKFVEYYGEGYRNLDLADRATLANMGPEYGATTGFCPVDEKTIEYLRLSGRDETTSTPSRGTARSRPSGTTTTPSTPTPWSSTSPPWSPASPGTRGPRTSSP